MRLSSKHLAIIVGVLLSLAYPLALHGVESITKNDVTFTFNHISQDTILVIDVYNKSDVQIRLAIDGIEEKPVNSGGSSKINRICTRSVRLNYGTTSGPVMWQKPEPAAVYNEPVHVEEPVSEPNVQSGQPVRNEETRYVRKSEPQGNFSAIERLNADPYFSQEAVNSFIDNVESYMDGLAVARNKSAYISEYNLRSFVSDASDELSVKSGEIPAIASGLISTSGITDSADRVTIMNLVIETLRNRLSQRQQALSRLQETLETVPEEEKTPGTPLEDNIVNYAVIAVIVLILIIWFIVAVRRKKKNGHQTRVERRQNIEKPSAEDQASIVVRRRTTSMLKKQSLEDVIGNPAYYVMNLDDYVADSAVRTIYIKNTCIKEVYNLYADDLRKSDSPKEDGCMVLGRWVHDETAQSYDVSLESVVFPGDDAVFKEYELNFGGKIKLRIAERLRKLRHDTNLQYDLTCWIHSHPGLGVFFSNSDDNVQMQLRHAQHPLFLTAFVVDILTPEQEMGIFTFRHDGTMNSKSDLIRLHSLEDMYRWAVESEAVSFNRQDCFNILASAANHSPYCAGIYLNNNSIIDLASLVLNPVQGIIGWVIGSRVDDAGRTDFIATAMAADAARPATGIIGVLVSVSQFSLPTIRRLIAGMKIPASFAIVYSSKQMSLTSIPMTGGEMMSDSSFYGDDNIDNLKIWTRRKR